MYKDEQKRKEASRERMRKMRANVTPSVTPKEMLHPDKKDVTPVKNPMIGLLRDTEVKKEYDKLEPKYNKIKEKIRKTLEANLPRTEEELKLWRDKRWQEQEQRDLMLRK